MAESYLPEAAIRDYETQQMQRGEGLYNTDTGEFQEASHRREIRRMNGYIPEDSFNDAVADLTEEQAANQRAFEAYQEMMAQGQETLDHDDRFDPEYETYIDGQRVDDGSYAPEVDDDQLAPDQVTEQEDEGAEEDDDDEEYDIWEDVVSDDPDTWPDVEDVVDQLKEVSEYFQPDPDGMRFFREIADYAESKGDYEYTAVTRAIQQAYAGNLTVAQAYHKIVDDIGIQEAMRIWVDLEANGAITFD